MIREHRPTLSLLKKYLVVLFSPPQQLYCRRMSFLSFRTMKLPLNSRYAREPRLERQVPFCQYTWVQCNANRQQSYPHTHTNTFHLFTLYAFIHKCILKYRKCKHGTQLWGRTLCTHWNRRIARSHTWLFEPFTIAECYFYCDMQSDSRVAKTRSEPCVDVCECLPKPSVCHRSHIERHINVFVFSFVVVFSLSLCGWLSFEFANVSSLLACGFVSCYTCAGHFFVASSSNGAVAALSFIALSIPRLNCGLSLGFC